MSARAYGSIKRKKERIADVGPTKWMWTVNIEPTWANISMLSGTLYVQEPCKVHIKWKHAKWSVIFLETGVYIHLNQVNRFIICICWLHTAVADSKGVKLVRSNHPPRPSFLNILWKWNNFVSVRPNYFIFMGYLIKKKWDEISKADPHTLIHMNPLSELYITPLGS